jgi:hypothetical protein
MASQIETHRQIAARRQTHTRSLIPTVALVVGGLLILTSSLFPRADDPADYSGYLDLLVANAGRAKFVLLAVPLGILALAAGITSCTAASRCRQP